MKTNRRPDASSPSSLCACASERDTRMAGGAAIGGVGGALVGGPVGLVVGAGAGAVVGRLDPAALRQAPLPLQRNARPARVPLLLTAATALPRRS